MDLKTATETVTATTSQYIGKTIGKTAGYFLLGGSYALVTGGPILLTAAIFATSTLFDRIISAMLRDLVKKEIISVRTFTILHNIVNVLSCTALIITGIYLNILGPVAIVFVAINIIMSLSDLRAAVNTPPAQQQPQQQPQQPPHLLPAVLILNPQQPYPPFAPHVQAPQNPPPFHPELPPPYEAPTVAPSAPEASAFTDNWKELTEHER